MQCLKSVLLWKACDRKLRLLSRPLLTGHFCSTCLLRRLIPAIRRTVRGKKLLRVQVSNTASGPLSARTQKSSSIIINGVSTSRSRHIFLCPLNEQSPQLSSQLHMYGVCEAWRGVLPSPAPSAYCGQVNRRHQLGTNTAIHGRRSSLPSCSTHMKTSQPSAYHLSRGVGEAPVLSREFPHSSSPLLLILSSSSSSSTTTLIHTSLL
ncbi:hypothetical protein E3U43_015350 [Larimichthys crocea]|uniref:Uncharacterized protein n=1 Tax=Larimichthys crocea TaxID=215358 RepID=A0ACD3RPW2_LARCR|nr:hypothetical protein E3U43_015350 [Larimichthys crocea]